MPDRAVVDDRKPRYRYQIGSSGYWVECDAREAIVVYPDGREELYIGINIGEAPAPAPRALVAISPDRQWLVTLEIPNAFRYKFPDQTCFYVWQRNESAFAGVAMSPYGVIGDTGQSADDVLAAWLDERE